MDRTQRIERENILADIYSLYWEISRFIRVYGRNTMSDMQSMFHSQLTNLLVLRNDNEYREAIRRLNNEGLTRYRNTIFSFLSAIKRGNINNIRPSNISMLERENNADITPQQISAIFEFNLIPRRQLDIYAVKEGTVTEFYNNDYGTSVVIQDSSGIRVLYAHLASRYVSQGHVNEGDPIGVMGNTGNSTGIHLHLGVYPSGTTGFSIQIASDPENYIREGTYPTNTFITHPGGRFGRDRTYPNGTKYRHEGIDFSGIEMLPAWSRAGITGADGLEKNIGRG